MPFDVRCPECSAKLRLDEKPEPREELECAKCGSTFTGKEGVLAAKAYDAAKPADKSKAEKPKADKPAPAGKPKVAKIKEFQPRDLTNPLPILGIIAGSFALYVFLAWFTLDQIGKAGRVEDMIAMVPAECNVVRGANLKHLARYPGYKDVLDKYAPPNVKAGLTDIATAGKLKEIDTTDYLIVAKNRPSAGALYVIRCRNEFSADTLSKGLGGTVEKSGGETCYRLPEKGDNILGGSLMFLPSRRHIIVAQGAGGNELLAASIAAWKDKKKSVVPNLGDAGQLAVKGHVWVVIQRTGGMAEYLKSSYEELQKDGPMKSMATALEKSKVVAGWNSFGASIRFGYAVDCGSASSADSLVRTIKDGPMGKGDDSEPPNSLKRVVTMTSLKEFGAFMADLSYKSSGNAAYLVANMNGDKAKTMMGFLNLNTLGEAGQ